jgi:SAM-dependent methyltransferase
MKHADHVDLLRGGVSSAGGQWADLGSGTGAFTLALADLIGPQGTIFSVDIDRSALIEQEKKMRSRFPGLKVQYEAADFTRPLGLPPLDGVVMANSLHFHRKKLPIIRAVHGLLRSGGRLILVEYNVDRGHAWVPFPLSYPAWEELAGRAGFLSTRRIGTKPSGFLREIYSAVSIAAPGGY